MQKKLLKRLVEWIWSSYGRDVTQTTPPSNRRHRSRQQLLDVIRRQNGVTRADLCRLTGLSRSAVAAAVQDLLDERLVREDVIDPGGPGSGRGRPSALLLPSTGAGHVMSLDFGHTHVAVALATGTGEVLAEQRTQVPVDVDASAALDVAAGTATRLLGRAGLGHGDVSCVAAGIPAPIDADTKRIRSSAIMSGWVGRNPEQELHDLLGWRVVVGNDADLGAQGELRFGAARGLRDVVYVKVSDGLGASLVLSGAPYGGSAGLAGEIGHTQVEGGQGLWCRCGNRGCLETVVSTRIARDLMRQAPTAVLDPVFPLREAVEHPPVARYVGEAGRALGRVLADVCNWLNPSGIVLGGELGTAGERLVEGVRESIGRYAQPASVESLQVRCAQLGLRSELMGGVAVAAREAAYLA